jgi:hypothetical protein
MLFDTPVAALPAAWGPSATASPESAVSAEPSACKSRNSIVKTPNVLYLFDSVKLTRGRAG